MPAMPSYNHAIHLSQQNALLAGKSYPIRHLEDGDSVLALQTHSADRFLRGGKDDVGATHRRNPTRFSEVFVCDDFRMYDYKVRRCMRGRSHDWTDCPFAHPGEKARRRDPRKIHYSGSPCPDFRKGSCQRGDACEYAHGVFECWLHPANYRTQLCKDGKGCTRRVCFFAHSMQQLRHVAMPVEESPTDSVSMVDSHAHELHSHTHDSGSPVCTVLSESQGRVSMVDSCENAAGLPSQTISSEECLSTIFLPTNSPCGADSGVGSSSQDVYANVGSISETLSMLTLSSQSVSSSPYNAVSTMELFSSNAMGVLSEVHPPSSNFSTVAPGASDVSFAISQNDSFPSTWSSEPAIFSPASSLQLYTPIVGGLSSSNSHTTCEHSSYMNGSPSQQVAAWQTFLMHEGYNEGGESTFSASADEFSDMVHYGGYEDTAMLHGYLNAVGRRRCDGNEVANELNGASKSMGLTNQLALLRKELYEFSSNNTYGSYGLSSPTSTLAGPLYPSPFSSPPLSPLSTPSREETCNIFSSRGHGNVQLDDTSLKAVVHIQNVDELDFKHTFTDQQSLPSYHHSQLLGHGNVNTAIPRCSESLSFSHCTSGKNMWTTFCNNWNSKDTSYECGVSQLTFDDMQHNVCGRFGGESPAENAMPDLGWVHELVM